MFEAYLVTLAGVALAQASPGPNFLAVVSVALSQGRSAAMATVLGIATGMLIWASAMAMGLTSLLVPFPGLMMAMKLLGGLYLSYLALKAFAAAWLGKGRSSPPQADCKTKKNKTTIRLFLSGLLVILTNPKAALMWAAVAAFLFGAGLSGWQVAGFGPVAFVSGALIYGGWAWVFSSGFAMGSYHKFSKLIELAMGSIFGALGGSLVLSGMRDWGAR